MVFRHLQNYHTFHPERAIPQDLSRFDHEKEVVTVGNRKIYLRYRLQPTAAPFILFSHGNSSSIESVAPTYDFFETLGVSYLAYDYPGYGSSSGRPSEEGLYRSFDAAFEFVVGSLGVQEDRLFLYGLSLGGAVTIDALQRVTVRGAILESTFTSARDMARVLFPRAQPLSYIARGFDSLSKISRAKCDLLFIHGEDDPTVPAYHSEMLAAAATSPAYLYLIPECGHVNQREIGGQRYRMIWQTFLKEGVAGLQRGDADPS